MGSMASTVASIIFESCTFAALTRTASGMPWASTTRWRFVPCLPRSVGFLPVSWPPGAGTTAESSVARSQSMRSAWASSSRSTWCSLRQTPAWYQSRSLRQHVIPLPTPHLGRQVLPGDARLQHEQRRDPRPERIRQQFLRHGTLLHGSYSASLAAYATVLLGVLRQRRRPWSRSPSAGACGDTPGASTLPSVRRHA